MSYQSALVGDVFIVRWQTPAEEDPDRILSELAEIQGGGDKKYVYLGLIDQGPPPDDAARKAMARGHSLLDKYFHLALVVLSGSGFTMTLKRSAIAAILMLVKRQETLHVCATLDEALQKMPPTVNRVEVARKVQELEAED
jgi:hypothetical protein